MHRIEQESVLDSYTSDLKTNLETALLGPYLIRDAMRDNSYTKTQFETLAKHILKHSDGSQTIQLAPNGVITYSYPLVTHEGVINS